jgi:hypothetical protein
MSVARIPLLTTSRWDVGRECRRGVDLASSIGIDEDVCESTHQCAIDPSSVKTTSNALGYKTDCVRGRWLWLVNAKSIQRASLESLRFCAILAFIGGALLGNQGGTTVRPSRQR